MTDGAWACWDGLIGVFPRPVFFDLRIHEFSTRPTLTARYIAGFGGDLEQHVQKDAILQTSIFLILMVTSL